MAHDKMRASERMRAGTRRLGFNQQTTASCGTVSVVADDPDPDPTPNPDPDPDPGDEDGIGTAALLGIGALAIGGGALLAGRE